MAMVQNPDDPFDPVLTRAQKMLALDPLTPDGAFRLGRMRDEVVDILDALAAANLAVEACELGILLEQALEQLGEPPVLSAEQAASAVDLGPTRSRFDLIAHLLGIARADSDTQYEGELLLRQAELFLAHGDRRESESRYVAVQDLAGREGLDVLAVAALSGLAELARLEGNLFKAHLLYTKQEALTQEMGDTFLQSRALSNLAATALCMGDYRRGARYASSHLALCRQMTNDQGAAEALCNLGLAHRHLGELAQSKTRYQEALALAHRLKNEALEAAVAYNLGCLLVDGEPQQAAGLLRQAQKLARRVGAKDLEGKSRQAAGELSRRLRRQVV